MKRCLEKEKLQRLSRSVGTCSSLLTFVSIGSTRAGDSRISFGLTIADVVTKINSLLIIQTDLQSCWTMQTLVTWSVIPYRDKGSSAHLRFDDVDRSRTRTRSSALS